MVGLALFPPAIATVGYPGAIFHEYERPPAFELVDCDASKLTALDNVWKVFVAEVPPGPVITIVTPVGGGIVPPPLLGAGGSVLAEKGTVSHGATVSVPVVPAQAGEAGPPKHPNQFSGALSKPPP